MGTPIRLKSTPLERLRIQPQNFEFVQAVRLLEQNHYEKNDTTYQKASLAFIGSKALPAQEKIYLRQKVSLSFPAADLDKLTQDVTEQGFRRDILDVSFLGLVGISGALPTSFTELVLERLRLGDPTLKDFLDTFQHRILSFFYRAETKYRILLRYENTERGKENKSLNEVPFQSLHGNGLSAQNIKPLLPSGFGVFYAGLLAQKPRSAINLGRILSSYLSLPINVEQFRGNWLVLPQRERTKLSICSTGGAHNQLKRGALLGRKVWSVDQKFSLTIGPLDYQQFSQFLPGNPYLEQVKKIIKYYINNNLNYELKLILKAADIPFCQIKSKNASQLGWNTWLINKPSLMDREYTNLKG